jgi:hypothetical protein
MEAYQLKRADEEEKFALLALFSRRAQSFDEKTKLYTVQKVSDLVDVKAVEKIIFDEPILDEKTFNRLSKINENLAKYRSKKEVESNE